MSDPDDADDIAAELDAVKALLLAKNAAYGSSWSNPVRIMSRASPVEQLRVRIDDKLSRLARGSDAGEDVILDLVGYLVLLRIAERRATAAPAAELPAIAPLTALACPHGFYNWGTCRLCIEAISTAAYCVHNLPSTACPACSP